MSRTYRQDSAYREDAFRRDPDNRLLWRANKRRLDAEAIRDAALFVSGRLENNRPEASLVARIGDRPVSIIRFDKRVAADLDGSRHRSAYLPVIRDKLPDVIDLFDGAEPSLVTGKRETTNVPLQSLFLINSTFMQAQADSLASRARHQAGLNVERIRTLFELCFCRFPDPQELDMATTYLGENPGAGKWSSYCQALLCTAEFRNVD